MRHVILTCKNHPNLRWSTKECAVNCTVSGQPAGYNGTRNIFFTGTPTGEGMYSDLSGLNCRQVTTEGKIVEECNCSSKDLIVAEEDALVSRHE